MPNGPSQSLTVRRRNAAPSSGAAAGKSAFGALAAALLIGVMLLPVLAIGALALSGSSEVWWHLASTILPRALKQTFLLLGGVGILAAITGTATAWLVTMYRFPARDLVDRLLVMPLAMPTYIVAYCYVELLDGAGPVQSALRATFGWHTAREYWFPDVRSTGGAILVMSAVLYPYVYLSARASFVQQSICALEVARTLGRTANGAFWAVALPMARPALIAGVALVMMECLNDIGAVEYLGVETLTATVYATWVERQSLGGAAQIASVMLFFVFALFMVERISRGQAKFHHTTGRYRPITFATLSGWRGWLAAFVCLMPFVFGFAVPLIVLVGAVRIGGFGSVDARFWGAASYSLLLALVAAATTVLIGICLAHIRRTVRRIDLGPVVQLAGIGYAIPGTVLAIGLMIPLAALDIRINHVVDVVFGISVGQLLAGTLGTLVLAYTIRFTAISLGAIDAGFQRISPSIDAASRTLGETTLSTLFRVHLPILAPALGAAALMVFVDTMKELPATLLLHPFNVETLATLVYSKASAFEFGDAALASLAIVAVGLLPVLVLHRAISRSRETVEDGADPQ